MAVPRQHLANTWTNNVLIWDLSICQKMHYLLSVFITDVSGMQDWRICCFSQSLMSCDWHNIRWCDNLCPRLLKRNDFGDHLPKVPKNPRPASWDTANKQNSRQQQNWNNIFWHIIDYSIKIEYFLHICISFDSLDIYDILLLQIRDIWITLLHKPCMFCLKLPQIRF